MLVLTLLGRGSRTQVPMSLRTKTSESQSDRFSLGTVLVIVGLALALLVVRYLMADNVASSGRATGITTARHLLPAPSSSFVNARHSMPVGYFRVNA